MYRLEIGVISVLFGAMRHLQILFFFFFFDKKRLLSNI